MPPLRPLPRSFYVVTAVNFCFFLDFACFFLLPLYLRQLGASERAIGSVMGTGGLAGLCALPPLAALLDQVNRRMLVTAGALTMALASFSYMGIGRVGAALYLLRVAQGLSFTAAFVTASTLVAECAPLERRGEALGIFGISTLSTHAIAPAFGELIVRRYGFHALFALAGTFGLVAAALTLVARDSPPAGRPRTGLSGPPRRDPTLWLAALATTACGMGFGAVMTFVPTFVRSVAIERVGPFFLSYTAAAVAVRVWLGGLSDRFGRRPVLLPSLAVFALSIVILGSVASLRALVVVGILFGAGQGMTYPTMNALVVDLSGPGNLGRVQTFFSGSFSVGVVASAFVFGHVIERFGYPTGFVAASAAVALAIVVVLLAFRDLPAPREVGSWEAWQSEIWER